MPVSPPKRRFQRLQLSTTVAGDQHGRHFGEEPSDGGVDAEDGEDIRGGGLRHDVLGKLAAAAGKAVAVPIDEQADLREAALLFLPVEEVGSRDRDVAMFGQVMAVGFIDADEAV